MEDLNNIGNQNINKPNIPHNIVPMTKDMRFVGLFTIIYGVLNSLTIIGAIIGIPLIFMGMRIRESAEHYEYYSATGDQNALQNAFEKQYKYFNIQKILIIITIVLVVLYFIAIFSLLSVGVFNQQGEMFSLLN